MNAKTVRSQRAARHNSCQARNREVPVKVRSASHPYITWAETGYLPFKKHGEKFAVTQAIGTVGLFDARTKWRVTHISTGIVLRGVVASSKEKARDAALNRLREIGPVGFKRALVKIRKLIASA